MFHSLIVCYIDDILTELKIHIHLCMFFLGRIYYDLEEKYLGEYCFL